VFKFYIFEKSIAKLLSRHFYCNQLDQLEESENIDFVITIFGPSYWKPKRAKHLCGFALPWMIYPETNAYKKITGLKKIKIKLLNLYKYYHFKRESDFFWCETEIVKERMYKYLGFKNVNVIGNSPSHHFENYIKSYEFSNDDGAFKLLTVSAYYPHKNLNLIKNIIPLIVKDELNIKFYVTLTTGDYNKIFISEHELKYTVNLGVIKNEDCPIYYEMADAIFLPTLLECFSANYVEAMIMGKPILTSDLDFARSICKEAAIYFDADNPVDTYAQIVKLMTDNSLQKSLIELGKEQLSRFPDSNQRAKQLIGLCENYFNKL
jgi:glycosyltransferase involved in cell wall biosynthesis